MTSSMIVSFAFLVLNFVTKFNTHEFGNSCVFADFKSGIIHGRDCYRIFESDVKHECDEIACFHIKGGQRNAIRLGHSILGAHSRRPKGNSGIKVLTIALQSTAASGFRTGDSLTPFREIPCLLVHFSAAQIHLQRPDHSAI